MQAKEFHVNVLVLDKLPSMPPFGWIRSSFAFAQIPCDTTASTAICSLLEAPISSLSVELSQHAGGMALSWPRAPILHGNSNRSVTLGLASSFDVCTCISSGCYGNVTIFVTDVRHCQKCITMLGLMAWWLREGAHTHTHDFCSRKWGLWWSMRSSFCCFFSPFSLHFTSLNFRLHCYKSSHWRVVKCAESRIFLLPWNYIIYISILLEKKALFQATVATDVGWTLSILSPTMKLGANQELVQLVFPNVTPNVPLSFSIHPKMGNLPRNLLVLSRHHMGPMKPWQSQVWFAKVCLKDVWPQELGCRETNKPICVLTRWWQIIHQIIHSAHGCCVLSFWNRWCF